MTVLQRNNVTVSGEGAQAVVFVHGFGCDQHIWRLVVPAFEAHYRVVLLDLVGAGHSDLTAYEPARYASLDAHAADVLAVLHALDLHAVVFVGHSVGATIGVLAAAREPARFARLVLVAPTPRFLNDDGYLGGFEPTDLEELFGTLDDNYQLWAADLAPVVMGYPDRPALAAELTRSFCRTDPTIARHFARVTFWSDHRADLSRVRTPALILQSACDALVPPMMGGYLSQQLPGSQLVVLNTLGHCPHLSAPQAVVEAIKQFLPLARTLNMILDAEEPLPELDLRLTKENPEDLYEHAPCGYCSCLPDGTLVKINATLLGWLGYAREELVAYQGLSYLLTVGGRLHLETYGVPLLLLHGQVHELSYSMRRKDGTALPVLLSAALVRDRDGTPLVMHVTLFDITERRKYERELLRAKVLAEAQGAQLSRANAQLVAQNEQLLRTNADLDSFVYTASHDLKQPIDNMVGLFEELKRTATFADPEAVGMLGMFDEAVQQILGTINGLAEVVQVQRQLEEMPVETVVLQPLAEEIVRSLQPQASEADARIELDFTAAPALRMARPGVKSLLYNLISNALRYAQPGRRSHVRVSAARVGAGTVLTVQDNGRGIDLKRHRHHLFQLFRRFHPEVVGSGVGLYLVQRLVHQAGGRVEVDSAVGQGTVFRLYFPG